jgi:AAA domain/CopG-like RHH_1 or ribbon-helix-helix domain, RHH_5
MASNRVAPLSVHLPQETRTQLTAAAEQERRTVSGFVRLLVEDALAARERTRALIDRADVVAGTCVGLASVLAETAAEFDIAIIDEASKATPTETLVPMTRSKQWILVGDTRQLPPFIEVALEEEGFLEAHELTRQDLEETIFAQLVRQVESNVVELSHQHRMLRSIGDLVSQCFYGGRLTSERGDASRFEAVRRTYPKPVVWQSTSRVPAHEEKQVGTTFWNSAELQLIREGLRALQFYAAQLDEHLSVGVISAYAGHATELRRALRREDAQWTHLKIDVNPVDSFATGNWAFFAPRSESTSPSVAAETL